MQGGTKKTLYPWGNEAPDATRANIGDASWKKACKAASLCLVSYVPDTYWSDGYGFTAPVGSFPKGANPWGVLDLVGNVAEWTASLYSFPDSGTAIVGTRGGSFMAEPDPNTLRYDVDARHQGSENPLPFEGGVPHPYERMGMRCARDVSP